MGDGPMFPMDDDSIEDDYLEEELDEDGGY